MHKSLKPSTNLVLLAVYTAVLVGSSAIPVSPSRWTIIGVGAVFGLIAGVLQRQAVEENRMRFLAADSALAVREAMKASRAGRAAIYTLWAAIPILLLITIWQKEGMFVRMLAGTSAFSLVRDGITLKSCFMLQWHHK